jgi:hypothetical protein
LVACCGCGCDDNGGGYFGVKVEVQSSRSGSMSRSWLYHKPQSQTFKYANDSPKSTGLDSQHILIDSLCIQPFYLGAAAGVAGVGREVGEGVRLDDEGDGHVVLVLGQHLLCCWCGFGVCFSGVRYILTKWVDRSIDRPSTYTCIYT